MQFGFCVNHFPGRYLINNYLLRPFVLAIVVKSISFVKADDDYVLRTTNN